jgi:hypothetical protein
MALPGWYSLDSVARIHDTLEIAGFVLLGVLAIVEGFQFAYGHRKDILAITATNKQIEALQSWHMTPHEGDVLSKTLSPFQGQKAKVMCLSDPMSKDYASDIVDLLVALHWDLGPTPVFREFMVNGPDPIGIQVSINAKTNDVDLVAIRSTALVEAMFDLGLMKKREIFEDPQVDSDTIQISVCRRPK